MTNYRIFLLSLAIVSSGLLSGLTQASENDKPVMSQKTTTELNPVDADNTDKLPEIKNTVKQIKVSPHKNKQNRIKASSAEDHKPTDRNEAANPLDLSVPFKGSENGDLDKKSTAPNGTVNIFSTENKKKSRPLELEGGVLMSPEPEPEKRKSVDGAGIIFNLKP